MAKSTSTSTRVAGDVVAVATAVAPAERRTTAEQINYWARVGMQIERSASVATRMVLAVAAGEAQFSSLDPNERQIAHAVIDAQIAERVSGERFGAASRSGGRSTVSLADDGTLVEIAADGTTRPL